MRLSLNRPTNLLSIGARRVSVTASMAAIVGLAALVYFVQAARITRERSEFAHATVSSALAIMTRYESEEHAGRLTRHQAQEAALAMTGALRWSDRPIIRIADTHVDGPRPSPAAVPSRLTGAADFQPWGWIVTADMPKADLALEHRHLAMLLATLGVGCCALVGLLTWTRDRQTAAAARRLTAAAERIVGGDYDPQPTPHEPAFAGLAAALGDIGRHCAEKDGIAHAAIAQRTVKDRRLEAVDGFSREFGEVIAGALGQLMVAARKLSETAHELTTGNQRTQASVLQIVEGVTTSTNDLAAAAAATTELSTGVDAIVDEVARANQITRETVALADATTRTCAQLADASQRIGDVGSKINRIADQTKLLALNATIESSRAGVAGKGFAVVANEVKALAGQTGRATSEIGEDVNAIRNASTQTADAIGEVRCAIARVDAVSEAIMRAVERQGSTTRDLASKVQEVAGRSGWTSFAMEELAAIAEETGMMSGNITAASQSISAVAETLKVEVDRFLHSMPRTESAAIAMNG